MARAALSADIRDFDRDVTAKAKLCLLDFLSCAFEAKDHAWSKQAIGLTRPFDNGATVIGTDRRTTPGDAAFANATLGHGLVREDMHAGSICHHGVVIWPTLLALSERSSFSGAVLLAAAIVGYEAGAQIGKNLFNADLARLYRPTGVVAPLGAALAGSRALSLSEDAAISALSIAANTSSGLNEWPHTGGSEMYFHPGFAARNAIAAIELAEAGAYASETISRAKPGFSPPIGANRCLTASAYSLANSPRSWRFTTSRSPPAISRRLQRKRRCRSPVTCDGPVKSPRSRYVSQPQRSSIPAATHQGLIGTRFRPR
jgi:2-methylcitrate dehydratase PrpD